MLKKAGIVFVVFGLLAGCGTPVKESPKIKEQKKVEVKKAPTVQNSAAKPQRVITVATKVVEPQTTSAPVLTEAEKSRRNEINIFKLNSQINTYKFKNNRLPKDLVEVKQAVKNVPYEVFSGKNEIFIEKNGKGGWYYNISKGDFGLNR